MDIGMQPDALCVSGEKKGFICVGSYEMMRIDGVETRTGAIGVYDVALNKIDVIKQNAVLDIKMVGDMLLSAQSESSVGLHLIKEDGCLVEKRVFSYREDNPGALCLSASCFGDSVFSSRSDGSVLCVDGFFDGREETKAWRAHEYEAWCCHAEKEGILYTAGNDCLAKMWDVRERLGAVIASFAHPSGVCSVFSDEMVYTGCYDGTLRMWDKRKTAEPVGKYKKGGGIWRIQRNGENRLLLACVSDGCDLFDEKEGLSVWRRETDTLCYGVGGMEGFIFATDFYRKKLYRHILDV
eukprot:GHVN01063523.1.p2 GENE.GHVN01063523.1~~GHVN01063523.1.p2  ORF type:complete len:296 (-),score=43.31 GHVN01063523.1:3105-3992(-)